MKPLEVEVEGFPPGSVIWIKCSSERAVIEVTAAVQTLGLDEYTVIVTGPKTELTQMPRQVLINALKTINKMNTPDGALPN